LRSSAITGDGSDGAASQKQIRPGTMSALLGIVGVKETPAKSRLGFYMGLRNGTA